MRSRSFGVARFTLRAEGRVATSDAGDQALRKRLTSRTTEGVVLPVDRGPNDDPVVRATSVLGALRAHLDRYPLRAPADKHLQSIRARARHADPGASPTDTVPYTLADLLCGSHPEEVAPNGERALAPSALRVVHVQLTPGPPVEDPARVSINRWTGAAQARKLFQREVLHEPHLDVLLQVDLPILQARSRQVGIPVESRAGFDDLVAALNAWEPVLGGQRSLGYGSFTVSDLRIGVADPLPVTTLLGARTTLALLQGVARDRPTGGDAVRLAQAPTTSPLPRMDLPIRAASPLLLSPTVERDADGTETNASVTATSVPASTWRGILRSRCEYILRTCGRDDVCDSSDNTCGQCPTCLLFGSAGGSNAEEMGGIGLVVCEGAPVSGERLRLTHAPIDRFTGGAIGQGTYAEIESSGGQKLYERESFAPGARTTLTLRQLRPGYPVPEWAWHLLTLALRDLNDGLIGLGHSTTRGYGTVRIDTDLPPVPPDWLSAVPLPGGASRA